jgi:hypothetical protein
MGAFGPVPGGRFLSARASLVVRERAGCWLLAWLLCMINLSTKPLVQRRIKAFSSGISIGCTSGSA